MGERMRLREREKGGGEMEEDEVRGRRGGESERGR